MWEWHIGRIRWLALVVIPVILTVTSAVPCGAFSRSERDRIARKEFVGKTPDEVLGAAARVMELADPTCVHISSSDARMIAQRFFSVKFLILPASIGCYVFDLQAERKGSGTMATLSISRSQFCKDVDLPGDAAAASDRDLIEYPEVYRLFYRRVSSLLYGQPWITCTEASYCPFPNNLSALCLTADDNLPLAEELGGALPAERPSVAGSQTPGSLLLLDSFCLDAVKSKGSPSAKVKAAADLYRQGKIDREERNMLQAAILRGEI